MGQSKKGKPEMMRLVPGAESLGTFTRCRRRSAERGLKKLSAVKTVFGVLVFVALAAGAYYAVTTYIFPGAQAAVSTESSQSAASSEEAEEVLSSQIRYDEKSGLPTYENEKILFIVNSNNPLSDEYQPELVEAEGIQVDAKIRAALQAMTEGAKKDGVSLTYASGYVSPDEQQALYDAKVQDLIKNEGRTTIMARAKAEGFVPKPMESDTQTGLCITVGGSLEGFADTVVYRWLVKNAADYGFVFRYPEDKETYTRLEPDLRVLRYVGNDNAISMRQRSQCLEEYERSLRT